ncbi:MAG: hypothetical protein WC702_00415 [Patescibacteria group bacterium]|jgi:hypothetical protein
MRNILPEKEYKILKKLNTPAKVQDFLNKLPFNFEPHGDTSYSPMMVLKKGTCHCAEGAVLAALALRVHGHEPLLLDLTSNKNDFDHVVALFKKDGRWGAISKTNHAVLRYREPVYASVRELVMSYFHEYFLNNNGKKTLRSFSGPVNLKRFDKRGWMTTLEETDYIPEYLAEVKHFSILTRKQIAGLRCAEPIEIEAGKIVEWNSKKANYTQG